MIIRQETKKDTDDIRALHVLAFRQSQEAKVYFLLYSLAIHLIKQFHKDNTGGRS